MGSRELIDYIPSAFPVSLLRTLDATGTVLTGLGRCLPPPSRALLLFDTKKTASQALAVWGGVTTPSQLVLADLYVSWLGRMALACPCTHSALKPPLLAGNTQQALTPSLPYTRCSRHSAVRRAGHRAPPRSLDLTSWDCLLGAGPLSASQ